MKVIRFGVISYLVFILAASLLLATVSTNAYVSYDKFWSWFFIVNVVIIVLMRSLSGISATSLYSLYFYAFILFIGGRFIAYILVGNDSPFNMSFFANYALNSKGTDRLMSYIVGGMVAMELGFYLSKPWRRELIGEKIKTGVININVLRLVFIIMLPLVTLVLYQSYLSVQKSGYLGLYLAQTGESSSGLKSIISTFMFVFLGLAITHGNRKIKISFICLYFVMSLINLLYGVRGGFVTFIFFVLWIYSDFGRVKLSLIKVSISFIIMLVFIIFGFSHFSVRGGEIFSGQLVDNISSFFYAQGVTLMVFDLSTRTESYPWIPYLQNIFPGVYFIFSNFMSIYPHESSFSSFLSYSTNHNSFGDGYGLGWSIYSDFFVYSGGILPIFLFFSALWGYGISKLEQVARRNLVIKSMLISTAPAIIFISRAGLNTVIPLALYSAFIYLSLYTFSRIKPIKKIEFIKNVK